VVGRRGFKGRFNCLFALAENKLVTMVEMYVLGWGERRKTWKCRRGLLACEDNIYI